MGLQGKTTVIPVISKADTVATKHMNVLKKAVWETFKQCNLDPLESLGLDEDTDSVTSSRIAEEDEDDVSNESDQAPKSSPPSSPNSKRQSTQSIRRHKAQEDSKVD